MKQTNRNTSDELREELKSTPLDDGGHVIIECSNCGTPLCDIWIIRPTLKIKSEIIAQCCFCKDQSFTHHIDGQFNLGHVDGCAIANTEMDDVYKDEDDVFIQKILIKTAKYE